MIFENEREELTMKAIQESNNEGWLVIDVMEESDELWDKEQDVKTGKLDER